MAAVAWGLILLGVLLVYAGMTGDSVVSATRGVLAGTAQAPGEVDPT